MKKILLFFTAVLAVISCEYSDSWMKSEQEGDEDGKKVGIELDVENDEVGVVPGEFVVIGYRLTDPTENTVVTASSDGNYTVRVEKASASHGKIFVTVPETYVDGYVNVMVSDGEGYSFIRVINFYESEINLPYGYQYSMPAEGGDLTVPLTTNVDFEVSTSDSWLTVEDVDTRASMASHTLMVKVSENDGSSARTGKIRLNYANTDNMLYEEIVVNQSSGNYDPADMIFEVKVNSANGFTATLPLDARDYELDCYVDWGDGTVEHVTESNPSHVYEGLDIEQVFEVRISGTVQKLGGGGNVISVKQWGNTGLKSMNAAFRCMETLTSVAADVSGSFVNVTDLNFTFFGCSSLTAIPEGLFSNCPNVTYFDCTFSDCSSLTAIPEDLFLNCPNVMSFMSTFFGCSSLTAIPEDLFLNCPNVMSFMSTFFGCSSLTAIPEGLFSNCPDVTNFIATFGRCSSLTTIPEDLFSNCPNVTEFVCTFSDCSSLTAIPEGLFSNCPNVTYLGCMFFGCSSLTAISEDLFSNCPNVTDFDDTFSGCSSLTAIPEGLFSNCPNVTDFGGMFSGCSSLTMIPEGLFSNCPDVTNFGSAFEGCSSLITIPEGLFSNCPNVKTFHYTFGDCSSLTTIPSSLFDNNRKVEDFSGTFYGCNNISGESPYTIINGKKVHLYERENYPDYFFVAPILCSGCFGSGFYTDNIPDYWR